MDKSNLTKLKILEAASSITESESLEAVTLNNLARHLKTTSKNLLSYFSSFEELKKELINYIDEYFITYLMLYKDDINPLLSIGLAYIHFAKEKPNFFKAIFLSNHFKGDCLTTLIDHKHEFILEYLPIDVDLEKAKRAFMKCWFFCIGVSSMVSFNEVNFNDQELSMLLTDLWEY